MQTTTNLGLKKPESNEYVNVNDINDNSDTLDEAVAARVESSGGNISETVIETLEPIDTKYPVPSAGEKVKTFLGKILTFLKNIKPLEADVTLYVATTGSDTIGDGTSAKPFKTIQYAINTLPKDLGGFTVTIIVSAGAYPETVLVQGFHNGLFVLRSALGLVLSNDYQINDIICKFNTARIYMYGFNLITSSSHSFYGLDCSDIILQYFTAKQTSGFSAFQFDSCRARIENSIAANKTTGVYAYNSIVSSVTWNNQSLNNAVGIRAGASSTVHLLAGQPAGAIQFVTEGGEFLQENGTQISGIISSGLSCTWGTISGGYIRHGNFNGTAMVTINLRIIPTINMSSGTPYQVLGFPPTAVDVVSVDCHIKNVINYCQLNNTGSIVFALTQPRNNGEALVFNATYLTNS